MSLGSTAPANSSSPENSFDDVLEQIVLALESDAPLDRDGLVAQYPRWSQEIQQFIDNWLAMEHKTGRLAASSSSSPGRSSHEWNGKVIGDYQLLEVINSGGMGIVYRAQQLSLGRIVALKMVWNALRDKTRFRIEAEAAASLHHANIVSIHEVGEFDGQPFISMQYIEGNNLSDRLKERPFLPTEAAQLVKTIAMAVHYAHQRGILHRDLKPANVLMDSDGKPYVTDFGLAKQMGNSVELTRSGAIIGTPGYMAPEQAMGQVKSITVAADVYGLGAILYAVLTGDAPFKADSDLLTLRRVIEEAPVSPRSKRPEIDRNLETICLKCLEKVPTSRYASAKHLADDLERYVRGESVSARPVGFAEQRWRWCRRNPFLASLSLLAVALLVAIVLMSIGFAWREYAARLDSDEARIREVALRKSIDAARTEAEHQNQSAQRALVELYTSNGLWAAKSELHGETLTWFAQAARMQSEDDEHRTRAMRRSQSWFANSVRPIAAWQTNSPFDVATFQHDWRSWKLSPDLSALMFKSGEDFGVWWFETGEFWRPSDPEFSVTVGTWNHDATLIALGSTQGEVRIYEGRTSSLLYRFPIDATVGSLAFSHNNDRLAVASENRLQFIDLRNEQLRNDSWSCKDTVFHIGFSNDDSQIVAVTSTGTAMVFQVDSEPEQPTFELSCFLENQSSFGQQTYPEFSKSGDQLFLRTGGRRLGLFDTTTGSQIGDPIVTGQTFSTAISPDRTHCIAGGDNYARIQSLTMSSGTPTFARRNSRLVHQDAVTLCAFGGKNLVATGGLDQLVQLWPIEPRDSRDVVFNDRAIPLASIHHSDQIVGLLFPPEGNRLATVQRDGLVRIWETPEFNPPGYTAKVLRGGSTVKLVGEDHWLVAGTSHVQNRIAKASLRRISDGHIVGETTQAILDEYGPLLDTAISSDQKTVVTLHGNPKRGDKTQVTTNETAGRLQFWSFPHGRSRGEGIPLKAEPRSVVMHPNGNDAFVLTVNREVLMLDLSQLSIARSWSMTIGDQVPHEYTEAIPESVFNGQLYLTQNGDRLFAWGVGCGWGAWDTAREQPLFSTEFAKAWHVRSFAMSPDEKWIAVVIDDPNHLILIDAHEGTVLKQIEHPSKIENACFSPLGDRLVTAAADGRARVFELPTGQRVLTDMVHSTSLIEAIFSPDAKWLATLSKDMRLSIWDLTDGQIAIRPMNVPHGTRSILFSPDGKRIITSGLGTELQVIDLQELGKEIDFSVDHALLLGELLSAKSLGPGGMCNLTSQEWLERWAEYSKRH